MAFWLQDSSVGVLAALRADALSVATLTGPPPIRYYTTKFCIMRVLEISPPRRKGVQ
jgi:hypothetical protein